MAITKILARKGRLDVGIRYVLNGDKTQEQILTARLNCDPGHECRQMLETKRAVGKEGGVQYYHLIQSFQPGEVTPELALEIAREFAEEHLPGYQTVIGVHVDKEHIHAHILFNSVNADTGEKYHSNAQSYYRQIRAISDRLCRERGLSVLLQGEPTQAVSYIEWLRRSRGQPTFRSMLEEDLRTAIADANDLGHFFLLMEHMGYAQAFQALYYSADQIHHGALSRHVHFVLDEFAAMPLPGFTRELATMRSRNISASTIIQNMAQIKELYKDSWETIPGNSDTILYLGGNEASTHKYISEALGKATIDTRTHGQTKGRSGSYSTNFQMSGRELLTPDEVRGLDNRYAILFIRGARPVMDLKYELTQHPAIRHTVDGGGPPYIHKGKQAPAFTGTPLFQAFSAEELNESEENAA